MNERRLSSYVNFARRSCVTLSAWTQPPANASGQSSTPQTEQTTLPENGGELIVPPQNETRAGGLRGE
jgi:hypothetical protein